MGDRALRGPTIKVALTLAFGLTVGLWFLAGYQFTRRKLRRRADVIQLSVDDDGQGFELPEPAVSGGREGLGLIGIREHVGQLQGTLRIESAPRRATRIVVELPVRPRRRASVPGPAADQASVSLASHSQVLNG
jgi:hypothetical protein